MDAAVPPLPTPLLEVPGVEVGAFSSLTSDLTNKKNKRQICFGNKQYFDKKKCKYQITNKKPKLHLKSFRRKSSLKNDSIHVQLMGRFNMLSKFMDMAGFVQRHPWNPKYVAVVDR